MATMELSEGLSLVPCTVVALSFVRADLSVKPVDEWLLKEGLAAMFKKRFGLSVADRDLVVRREKDYFKKRRDEPVADGTLHLWGEEAARDGEDFGKRFVQDFNGVELSIGGLKLKCLAVVKETNDFEALKRSWEGVFGPRRGGAAQVQAGPTTLTLKNVPSRWFAEPRVSSKPSVLVTHTIFSCFGEIRNLEVLSNEDLGSNLKDVGSMAAALQCQIWVQFDNHANFCKALHAFCGRAMQKAGSNFRAMYVVDWDKENYFSVLNVRRRKFEKERLERQLQAEADRIRKEEIQALAELARVEAEKLKMEQMAAALREEERQRHLLEQAQKLEEESRKQMSEADTSSEEEGLIQDERQESSDDEAPGSEREEDDTFSPPQRVNGRYIDEEEEGERHLLPVRGKGSRSSDDEGALNPSRARVKRRYTSEDDEDENVRSPPARGKRRYTHEGRQDTVPVKGREKKRDTSEDEEVRHLPCGKKKRMDTSESESESGDEEERRLPHASKKKRRDTSEDETERHRGQRRYTSEDEEERRPSDPQSMENRRFVSDDTREKLSPDLAGKRVGISQDGERNVRVPEESADQEMYNPLERWQPAEEETYYTKSSAVHEEERPVSRLPNERRMTTRQRSPSPSSEEEEESDEEEYVERRGIEDDSRWPLEVTHSAASLSASEMLFHHKAGLAEREAPEWRLRSVIIRVSS